MTLDDPICPFCGEPEELSLFEMWEDGNFQLSTYGTSLRAAGWICEGPAGGRGWHSHRRARSNRNAWIMKQRWSRTLHPKPLAGPRLHPPMAPGWLDPPGVGASALFA